MSMSHRFVRMTGRDPNQAHRASTPLELLFDLTFVIAFSQAGSQAAHLLELGHVAGGVLGFCIAMFAVTWAWINYSWLASAYDTDDLFFRIATLIQMVGVLVMALGFPQFFHSLDEGNYVDNSIMIAGYVVMRCSTIALWLRAAKHDPSRRSTARTYAIWLSVVQVGWLVVLIAHQSTPVALSLMTLLVVAEMLGPWIAERKGQTPWHAHHIAERYGLIVIITLGEVLLGTILAISAVVEEEGWSSQAIFVAFGGTLLAFAMWWSYFILPSGRILHRHRDRASRGAMGTWCCSPPSPGWARDSTWRRTSCRTRRTSTLCSPCCASRYLCSSSSSRCSRSSPCSSASSTRSTSGSCWALSPVLASSVVVALLGGSIGASLVGLAMSPVVIVVGYEVVGHRHEEAALRRNDALP